MLVIMHDRHEACHPASGRRHGVPRTGGRLPRQAAVFVLFGAMLAAGPGIFGADDPGRTVRNVILISIDSLRADHLPFFGYPRMTAPFLSSLVEGGHAVLFDHVTAVAPSCHPSHTTMLTGLYPQQVGVPFCGEDLVARESDLRGETLTELEAYQEDLKRTPAPLLRKKTSAVMNWLQIPEGTQTLATYLKSRGFRTGGFVSIWTVQSRFGYGRGFDVFADAMPVYYGPASLSWILRDYFRSQRRQESSATIDALLAFLRQQDAGTPFFAFVNLADTHVPYHAPDSVRFDGEDPAARATLEASWRRHYTEATWEASQKRLHRGSGMLLDAYDRSIKYTDELVKRVFDELAAQDLARSTLVVITSDHGDSFGQHFALDSPGATRPFFEHSVYVWEETQHVPLILAGAGVDAPGRRRTNVSQVDLVPTILAALGQPKTDFGMGALPGRDLHAAGDEPHRVHFLTFGRGRPGLLRGSVLDYPSYIGFTEGDLKFFVDRKRFRDAGRGRCFMYDLSADPDEKTNLCGEPDNAARAAAYRAQLIDWYNGSIKDRPAGRRARN